jgi:hypothetical protein
MRAGSEIRLARALTDSVPLHSRLARDEGVASDQGHIECLRHEVVRFLDQGPDDPGKAESVPA